MKTRCRLLSLLVAGLLLCLALVGCTGDSPWRYSPGVPKSPTALAAASGNGQVSLSWTPSDGAAAYDIYYGTSPGVTKSSGNRVASGAGNSSIVTGLANDVTYYFAVTAVSSSGESPLSGEVSAAPSAPGSFQQSDLQGIWYFNALVTGPAARWMRGAVTVDGAGNVAVTSFLDSAGNSAAPADLFSSFTILPDGFVSQSGSAAGFQGTLSANQYRDTLVGSATTGGSSRMMIVLQKRVPGITYTSSDIKGTGRLVAGPLTYVYHQLSSGSNQEWEVGSCQVGQDQSVTYAAIKAPTLRQLPGAGNKVVSLSVTPDGRVTETPLPGILPQPAALLTRAVMSADKMAMVGTATDASGAFVLRVVQLVHPPSVLLSASSYLPADLAGSYVFHDLAGGAISSWAYGNMSIDTAGVVGVTALLDSSGAAALPTPVTVAMDQEGVLTDVLATSYSGKLSYFKDMVVATGTDPDGAYRLSISLKR